MNDTEMAGHPTGAETDDTQNPTSVGADGAGAGSDGAGDGASRVPPNVQSMLMQLQQMIDNVAVRSGPVLREVAAKAAELAAVAGERAGPFAYKAAETTQKVGQRVAERSKEFAADLRSREEAAVDAEPAGMYGGEPTPDPDAGSDGAL
jgi:hypothetical protein